MSGEISERYGKAKTLIALDPPSEMNGRYKVYQNPLQDRKNFKEYAQFSRSFVGDKSFAGNHSFAKSADEPITVDFGSTLDAGAEHRLVWAMWEQVIYDRIFDYNIFDAKDLQKNPLISNHSNDFLARVKSFDRENQFVETQKLTNNNNMRYVQYGVKGGNQFLNEDMPNIPNSDQRFTVTVKNFNDDGDRISLKKGTGYDGLSTDTYNIFSTNITPDVPYPTIYRTHCGYSGIIWTCTQIYADVVVQGDRVSNTPASVIYDQLEKAKRGEANDWFVTR